MSIEGAKTLEINDELHSAYHESGHWVAAFELEVLALGLSIIPDSEEQTAGRVPVEGGNGLWLPSGAEQDSPQYQAVWREHAEKQAIISYAGHAAVVSILGIGDMSEESAIANGAGMDFEQGKKWFEGDSERIDKTKARAIEIVTSHRAGIERIASKLFQLKTLDGQQAEQLLYDNWSYWYNDDGSRRG